MKTVLDDDGQPLKIGRFTIMLDRSTYRLRWYDSEGTIKQPSEAVGKDLEAAKREAHRRMAKLVRPEDVVEDQSDPKFGEFWLFYFREKEDLERETRRTPAVEVAHLLRAQAVECASIQNHPCDSRPSG